MKKLNVFKFLKYLVVILFILSVVVIGTYPFKVRNVTITVDTVSDQKSFVVSVQDIQALNQMEMNYSGIPQKAIEEIRFYRQFDSVCVGKMNNSEIFNYVSIEEDRIIFNEKFCEFLKEISSTFMMERLIYAEVVLALVILLLILINAAEEKLNFDIHDNHGPIYEIKRFMKDLVKYGEYIIFSAKADLNAEVANSYLNRLWWILEPFFNMLVYVVVFGRIMGNSIQNYATFVFSALLMWNYFSKTINYSVKCVRNNRDIVTKVYVPKYVLLLSNMVLNFIKLLFSLIVLLIMLVIFQVHIGWAILWVLPAYILMIILSFGAGMIFLHFGVYVDDLAYAVGILLQMLMFLSGIFYDVMNTLATPLNGILMCMNPVAMFTDTMRNALLNNIVVNIPLIAIWIILSLLLCYVGIHIVYKNENGYVKVV